MSLAHKAQQLWAMKPVQLAAKSVAAGTVVAGTLVGLRAASSWMLGDPDAAAVEALVAELPDPSLKAAVRSMAKLEPGLAEILARLHPFRRFAPDAFDDLVRAASVAVEYRSHEYESRPLSARASFRIRADYQRIIEKTRLLRAFLEKKMESLMEDFDEVAVDINAAVESACTDAIQDTFT